MKLLPHRALRALDRLRATLRVDDHIAELKLLAAKNLILAHSALSDPVELSHVEFKVFSQFGEDGILQYLIRRARIEPKRQKFVEFGVETYREANTRFLLINDNWCGLVLDGSKRNVEAIVNDPLFWRHDLRAVSAFITAENVDALLVANGFGGEIGVLSIDIDGNDYWVWKAIESVEPVVVVVEYNSVLGAERAVTIPYNPKFQRARGHSSNLYWGCSLKALWHVGQSKGYALVGSNSAGNNAFFVHRDHLNGQPALTAEEAYVESKFRESRDRSGRLSFVSGSARLREIAGLPLIDVEDGSQITTTDLSQARN